MLYVFLFYNFLQVLFLMRLSPQLCGKMNFRLGDDCLTTQLVAAVVSVLPSLFHLRFVIFLRIEPTPRYSISRLWNRWGGVPYITVAADDSIGGPGCLACCIGEV